MDRGMLSRADPLSCASLLVIHRKGMDAFKPGCKLQHVYCLQIRQACQSSGYAVHRSSGSSSVRASSLGWGQYWDEAVALAGLRHGGGPGPAVSGAVGSPPAPLAAAQAALHLVAPWQHWRRRSRHLSRCGPELTGLTALLLAAHRCMAFLWTQHAKWHAQHVPAHLPLPPGGL